MYIWLGLFLSVAQNGAGHSLSLGMVRRHVAQKASQEGSEKCYPIAVQTGRAHLKKPNIKTVLEHLAGDLTEMTRAAGRLQKHAFCTRWVSAPAKSNASRRHNHILRIAGAQSMLSHRFFQELKIDKLFTCTKQISWRRTNVS